MRFVVAKGEKNLAELIKRTLDFKAGPGGSGRAKALEDRIRQANPALAETAELPAGTVVLIPDLPDLNVVESPPQLDGNAGELLGRLAAAAPEIRKTFDEGLAQSEADTNRELEFLASPELVKAAKRSPALKEALPAATAAAKARLKELKSVRETNQTAMDALDADLKDLLGRFGTVTSLQNPNLK